MPESVEEKRALPTVLKPEAPNTTDARRGAWGVMVDPASIAAAETVHSGFILQG